MYKFPKPFALMDSFTISVAGSLFFFAALITSRMVRVLFSLEDAVSVIWISNFDSSDSRFVRGLSGHLERAQAQRKGVRFRVLFIHVLLSSSCSSFNLHSRVQRESVHLLNSKGLFCTCYFGILMMQQSCLVSSSAQKRYWNFETSLNNKRLLCI